MLPRLPIPGLFITGTDTGVGKTVVAGAIGEYLSRRGLRVGVFKPIATGCVSRREGLVSEDAELLAHLSDCRQPLDLICPRRYREPLAPAVAAEREGEWPDWSIVGGAMQRIAANADVMIVEGVGGLLVPLDQKYTVLDLARWLALPVIVVARAGLGTINHTLLTLNVLRQAGVPVGGVVVNGYPAGSAGIAEETNPRIIERWGKVPVLTIVPQTPLITTTLPRDIAAAIERVDWRRIMGVN